MTNTQCTIRDTIINIVSKHVNISHNDLDLNAKLIEDLNCSILTLKVIFSEIGINLELPDCRIETTNDLINYVSYHKESCKENEDDLQDYYGDMYDIPYVKREQKETIIEVIRDVLGIKDLKISDDQHIKDLPGADNEEIQKEIINELEKEFGIILISGVRASKPGLLELHDLQDFRCHSVNQIVDFLHPHIKL